MGWDGMDKRDRREISGNKEAPMDLAWTRTDTNESAEVLLRGVVIKKGRWGVKGAKS